MTFFESILLGALEGLTEFLPVSSTGHLVLASGLLGLAQTDFVKSFEIAIQLGSILAVAVLFWREFLDPKVLMRLAAAFVPTGVVGLVLYKLIKGYLIGEELVVLIALFVGGIAILLIEHAVRKREQADGDIRDITLRQAVIVGLAQSIAVIPGVSRSAATVMGGLLLGIPRAAILRFSFLLAVPTMLAATAYDLYKTPDALAGGNLSLMGAGFATAFVVALLSIRAVLAFVKKHSFAPFGVYRIVLAVFFFLFLF